MIRVIIVDDEALARDGIRLRLSKDSDFVIVAEQSSGEGLVRKCVGLDADLVFLDIEMPGPDGLAVARSLAELEHPPLVVFVTAYGDFAVRAFEANAVDYLLKPVTAKRFGEMIERIKERLSLRARRPIPEELLRLLQELREQKAHPGSAEYLRQFSVQVGDRIKLIKAASVDWIEAQSYYAALHVGKETHLLRESLRQLAGRLDPAMFIRIHRSAIVNRERVKELARLPNGDYDVILTTGTRRRISRSYRAAIDKLQK